MDDKSTENENKNRKKQMNANREKARINNSMNAATITNPVRFQALQNGSTALPAGTPAPDFALKSTPDQTVRLSEFRGQPVVLVFYPADWSPVCGDQVGLYNEMLSEFQGLGA